MAKPRSISTFVQLLCSTQMFAQVRYIVSSSLPPCHVVLHSNAQSCLPVLASPAHSPQPNPAPASSSSPPSPPLSFPAYQFLLADPKAAGDGHSIVFGSAADNRALFDEYLQAAARRIPLLRSRQRLRGPRTDRVVRRVKRVAKSVRIMSRSPGTADSAGGEETDRQSHTHRHTRAQPQSHTHRHTHVGGQKGAV